MITSIAGATGNVRVTGIVRTSGEAPLTSPMTKRPCICFEVHSSMMRASSETQRAQSFFVEDTTGRALVIMDRFELSLGALARAEEMSVLDADISKVSGSISDLKVKSRTAEHDQRREIDGQLRELKGLATLLCAIRAHTRGNVHVGKTAAGQERYIEEQSQKYEAHGDEKIMPSRYLQRFDTILCEGDTVEVAGVAAQEPDPERAAGYRDRALRTVIRAPEDGVVVVASEGAEAAARALAPQIDLPALALESPPATTSSSRSRLWGVTAFALVAAAIYAEFC